MSSINFETKGKSVSVRGTERHYAAMLVNDLVKVFLDPDANGKLLQEIIPKGSYLKNPEKNPQWGTHFCNALSYGISEFSLDGVKINGFLLGLNTAVAIGNDALKLLASIHGQCEVHAYVLGKNRAWMADVIENGPLDIFRPDTGWADVVSLLRENDTEPVILSYSITEGVLGTAGNEWVNEELLARDVDDPEETDEDGYTVWDQLQEEWYEQGEDKQWAYVLKWLSTRENRGLELSPERFATQFHFGLNGMTAGKLIETLRQRAASSVTPV